MSADVRDILDIERANTPEITRDSFLATKKRNFERLVMQKSKRFSHIGKLISVHFQAKTCFPTPRGYAP